MNNAKPICLQANVFEAPAYGIAVDRRRGLFTAGGWPLLALLCLFLCQHAPATAQTTETWTNADGNNLWTDGNNWSPTTGPGGPNGNVDVLIPAPGAAHPARATTRIASPAASGGPCILSGTNSSVQTVTVDQLAILNIRAGGILALLGTTPSVNNGTIDIDQPGGSGATLAITGPLSSSGQILLEDEGSVVSGSGTMTNTGTVSAVNGGQLTVNTVNQGTMTSAGTAAFNIQATINNAGGTISGANGSLITFNSASVAGGLITTSGAVTAQGNTTLSGVTISGSGILSAQSVTLDGTSAANTISSQLQIPDGGNATLKGTVNLLGQISLNAVNSNAQVTIAGNVTMNGGGSIVTSNNPNNRFTGFGKSTLTLNGPGFLGSGDFGGATVKINITKLSTVTANQSAPLIIDGGSGGLNNQGTIAINQNDEMQSVNRLLNLHPLNSTLMGGIWNIAGTLRYSSTTGIQTNSANVTMSGANAQVLDGNGNNAFASFSSNSTSGKFTITGGWKLGTSLSFNNFGRYIIGSGSTFTVNGSSGFTQSGNIASLTVDGTLAAPAINIMGGTVYGNGATIAGPFYAGSSSTRLPTVTIGDKPRMPGLWSINGSYTQGASILNITIGGTTQGTGYSHVDVAGTTTLGAGSTLALRLGNGFVPTLGQTFNIMNAQGGVSGTWSIVTGTKISSSLKFFVAYQPTSVDLVVVPGP